MRVRIPPRLTALAIAVAVAALAIPAAANAAVAVTVVGNQLTITGDAASDNITLGTNDAGLLTHSFVGGGLTTATDFNPDPGTVGTLPSNGSISVTINAAGGNDNVNLSGANLASSTINGGDGDDIIVGSAAADTIDGNGGNDRLTGFRGADTVRGGDGNDVLIWNNGDGSDVNDGGNNTDEVLITTGSADDVMAVTQNGARTVFARISPGPFNVDMGTVERLTITSFAGNDSLTTGEGVTLPMSVDGGPGDDSLATGDGADLLNGGDGNDTLNGNGGGDRIVGDRGADTMNGGAGDDTLVWNNGDGSDVMNGDDGVDRIETNLSAADDTATIKLENGRVRFDRLNPGPFNLSIGTAEAFELNTLGGNDTFTAEADVWLPLIVDGGAGNDTLQGGKGNDALDGGDGDDKLLIRDGEIDFVRGGPGADTAVADQIGVDAVAPDVEQIDWLPSPTTNPNTNPGPSAATAAIRSSARVVKGAANLRISCPAASSGCTGSLLLVTAKAVRVKGLKAQLMLGRKQYSLRAGEARTLKVKLAAGALRLARKGKLAASVRITGQRASERTQKLTLAIK
jgi:Ca2+-binding RTX toxin-like protein